MTLLSLELPDKALLYFGEGPCRMQKVCHVFRFLPKLQQEELSLVQGRLCDAEW